MLKLVVLSVVVLAAYGGWKPDPLPEAGTDQATFDSHPAVMQARKMAKLMTNQDVVTTCRYMLFKKPLPFHEANEACNSLSWPITNTGIGMATVQNEDENNDIKNLLRLAFGMTFDRTKPYKYGQWTLIGLSKRVNNDRKLAKNELGNDNVKLSEWYYTNNHMANYTQFHRDMPDQQSKGSERKGTKEYQNWIQINKKGYWDDTYSSKSLPYTCEYCGKYIVLSKHVSWDSAKAHCEDVGLKFATVNSDSDNRELLFAANAALGEELGGKRFNNSNWVWIGEQEEMIDGVGSETWTHHDGSELAYSPNWDFKSQPDNWILPTRGEQNVAALSRKDGKWDDSFKHKKRPFACMCPERACQF